MFFSSALLLCFLFFFFHRCFFVFSPPFPSFLRSSCFPVLVANNRKLMPMIRRKKRGLGGATEGERRGTKESEGKERRKGGRRRVFCQNEERTERESARAVPFTSPSYTRKRASGGSREDRAIVIKIKKREVVASRPSFSSLLPFCFLLSLSPLSLAREIFSSSFFFIFLFLLFSPPSNEKAA